MREDDDARGGRGSGADPQLVGLAAGLAPGAALVIGCGAGAEVVWLAERGWRVTGVDASTVALDWARRLAGEAGVMDRLTLVEADVAAGDDLPGGHDLVAALFVPAPEAEVERVCAAIAGAVRPGGAVLVAGNLPAERVAARVAAVETVVRPHPEP